MCVDNFYFAFNKDSMKYLLGFFLKHLAMNFHSTTLLRSSFAAYFAEATKAKEGFGRTQ